MNGFFLATRHSSQHAHKKNHGTSCSRQKLILLFYQHRTRIVRYGLVGLSLFFVFRLLIKPAIKWGIRHAGCHTRERNVEWTLEPSTLQPNQRPCSPSGIAYETLLQSASNRAKICMTSLKNRPNFMERLTQCRDFDQVDTFENHRAYANLHGYYYEDTSHLMDSSRPPAWSKIKAVQYLFEMYSCEWVWWLDVDVVIMNPDIQLESLIPESDHIHFIAAEDKSFSVNSGSWIIRKSEWSTKFLNDWWNSKNFIRSKGISLSGDNAALASLVDSILEENEASAGSPVMILPRCHLNSFGVFMNALEKAKDIAQQPWYMSNGYFYEGDFVAHAAGIDRKMEAVQLLLNQSNI